MDLLKGIAYQIRSMATFIPAWAWLVIIGLVVGLPTSLYGLTWMEFKFVKEEADCANDIHYDIADPKLVLPQQQVEEVVKAGQQFQSCIKSIHPNTGTIEFLKKQNARRGQGRL